jgi:hypothetical protein
LIVFKVRVVEWLQKKLGYLADGTIRKKVVGKNRFLNSHFPLNVVSRSISGNAQIWEKQQQKRNFG